MAAAIAVGNTLEAVAGAFLLRRVGFRNDLGRVRDVLALVVLAAGLSTLISATNGVIVLSLAHAVDGSYASEWLLWWWGDAVGHPDGRAASSRCVRVQQGAATQGRRWWRRSSSYAS